MEDDDVITLSGRFATRCQCGNLATEGDTCQYCVPHDHDVPKNPHQFSWPAVICAYCGLMAQDCCEKASECPGDVFDSNPVVIQITPSQVGTEGERS